MLRTNALAYSDELTQRNFFFQNEVAASKGIAPAAPANFKPVIKKSVTYIVAAVLVKIS